MELLSNRVLDPFPQGLMGKSMDLLGGLRSTMEGERELLLCFGHAEVRKKRQCTVGEEGEEYKCPNLQRSLKSWQCHGSNAAVPHYDNASL